MLTKLKEAGFQMDIKNCEFDVEKTVFLKIIISGQNLRMDFCKKKCKFFEMVYTF